MLDVETNHQIILLYFKEGLSLRKIARQLSISRDTVKARIVEYEQFKAAVDPGDQQARSARDTYLNFGPVYDSRNRGKRRLTDEIMGIINGFLEENEVKRLDGRKKQQICNRDIHEKLQVAGFPIGYTTVSEYIRTSSGRVQEAFIKQGYGQGSVCEFDWAEVKIYVDGKYRRYYLAVFTSAFSNFRYALLFQRQDTLAFKEAHICFFEHTGGVFHQMVYDNMRVAVAQFVGKTEKTPTESLLQLSRWYQYQWRFCNAAKGNEKGHVERSVEYIRRKVFGFKDAFNNFQEASDYLQQRTTELNGRCASEGAQSPAVNFETERQGLYAYPGRLECFTAENLRVDKYATITFGTNRYSVPDRLVGTIVFVKVYSEWLKIYDDKAVVCEHKRCYERYGWLIDLNHYLITLHRKPGAIAGSVALKQAPQWMQDMYLQHFIHDSRSFIALLQYCQLHTITDDRLMTIVQQLVRISPCVMATHVMALLGNESEEMPVLSNAHDPIALIALENLAELTCMMNYN